MTTATNHEALSVVIGPHHLNGLFSMPAQAKGLVIFAHGSGSGRFSPRNNHVARALQMAGFATLLLDLLTPSEDADRANVFDLRLLARRLIEATDWAAATPELKELPVGYFGASTGAGAALIAAALADGRIAAIVSRGGRPDLAKDALPLVKTPTLLLVGSMDSPVLDLNRWALSQLRCTKEMLVVPGASHLFEEPGTLDIVVREAIRWFEQHLGVRKPVSALPFADRRAAGRALAKRLEKFRGDQPLVLGLPRGGVPVAFEVATALEADLDLLLVRKLGAPGQPEFGIGAIIDGANPQIVLNEEIMGRVVLPSGYVHNEAHRQMIELEHRRKQYDCTPLPVSGRTVIVVDDGIATGGTVRAALRGIRKKGPAKLILAVPVAPRDTIASLVSECDELICLEMPDPFYAVGAHYSDFSQTTNDEVKHLLHAVKKREMAS